MIQLKKNAISCSHCGTLFTPKSDEKYCSQGCAYVARLREEKGFGRFYELKGGQTLPPVSSRVFQKSNFDWLAEQISHAESEAQGPIARASFHLQGVSCVGCVWQVEALFNRCPGAVEARIDVQSHRIELSWEKGTFNGEAFAEELKDLGYGLAPLEKSKEKVAASSRLARRLGLCGAFLMNTMLFTLPSYLGMSREFFLAPAFDALAALFATLSLLFGGSYFFKRAWKSARLGVLHIDLPIALGIAAAYVGSVAGWLAGYTTLIYFDFVATFIFLMLGGRWLQEFALEKNQAHIERRNPAPQFVITMDEDQERARLPVSQVEPGLVYVLQPGDVNPVAADLVDDSALISLEWINGEADPVAVNTGKTIPAGAINVGLKVRVVRARESWKDSLLARLLEKSSDNLTNTRMQRILQVYLTIVLLLSIAGFGYWYFAGGDLLKAVQVMISILVVSCPCALGVALPMADEFAINRLRRCGLFIKHSMIWPRLRAVKKVVFDKTGTLTMDTPELRNPEALDELDTEARHALFALVKENLHPVARCLRAALLAHEQSWKELRQSSESFKPVEEVVGQGVFTYDAQGRRWSLGKPEWLATGQDWKIGAATVLRVDGELRGAFHLSDDVRDDAVESVAWLQSTGHEVAILSGDAQHRVSAVADALGVKTENALGECSPEEKARWLGEKAPGAAMMIGDGANDSLAFKRAICRGTPVVDRNVLESASDFFFFGRSLRSLPILFATARRREQTVKVMFSFAVAYNVITVTLCLMGHMHPLMAAILMPISSICTLGIAWSGLGRGNGEVGAARGA